MCKIDSEINRQHYQRAESVIQPAKSNMLIDCKQLLVLTSIRKATLHVIETALAPAQHVACNKFLSNGKLMNKTCQCKAA